MFDPRSINVRWEVWLALVLLLFFLLVYVGIAVALHASSFSLDAAPYEHPRLTYAANRQHP